MRTPEKHYALTSKEQVVDLLHDYHDGYIGMDFAVARIEFWMNNKIDANFDWVRGELTKLVDKIPPAPK